MRIDPLDDLAVELKHQPQYAVRSWMLRTEIDREIPLCWIGHVARPLGGE